MREFAPHPTPRPFLLLESARRLGYLLIFLWVMNSAGKNVFCFLKEKRRLSFAPRFKNMIIQFSCSLITFEVEHFSGIFVEGREPGKKAKPELIARRSFSTKFFVKPLNTFIILKYSRGHYRAAGEEQQLHFRGNCHSNSLWGLPLGILGVPPGSPNPDAISDQKMPFFSSVFRPGL